MALPLISAVQSWLFYVFLIEAQWLILIKHQYVVLAGPICVWAGVFLVGHLKARYERGILYEIDLPPALNAKYDWKVPDGKEQLSEPIKNGKIYPLCPADGRSLGDPITPATIDDIDAAITRAQAAQIEWSKTTFSQRRRVLNTLLKYITAHQDEIVTACCLDSGKTKIDACFGEILVTAEKLQWTIKHGEKALRPSWRPTNLLMLYKSNKVLYEPLGVVATAISWNYPFHNFISPVIAALFTGNAIVIKPSEQTVWSTQYFTALIHGALSACGQSPDIVQNIICLPDVADHLTSHPSISHITFIGSRPIALKVLTSAARALTPVTVELGGKDPAIILDDPTTIRDIESVSSILLRGVFQSAGQNCVGIERVIALPKIHDALLEKVKPIIANMRLGSALLSPHDSIDMGAMISPASFDRLESLISAAVDQGATLHCGGGRFKHPQYPAGYYFAPTLLSDVTPSMAIAQTELFAPVFLLMRAASVSEAIEIANGTSYGLGASVFGHDSTHVRRCVGGLKCGMVSVNDFGSYYAVGLPFGGVGGSGFGRFGGEEGLRGLCNAKSVCEDGWVARRLGVRTRIPGVLRYPVEAGRGWEVCCGIVGLGYGLSVWERGRGLMRLLGGLVGAGRGGKAHQH